MESVVRVGHVRSLHRDPHQEAGRPAGVDIKSHVFCENACSPNLGLNCEAYLHPWRVSGFITGGADRPLVVSYQTALKVQKRLQVRREQEVE